MSELVTGEAVVLGLRTARLPSRGLARALDGVVYGIGYLVTLFALSLLLSRLEAAAVAAVSLTTLVFFLTLLPILIETLSHGRSLGKVVFGLRVVRADGGPIRFRHALVRGLVGIVDFGFLAMPAVFVSLFNEQGKRLGDIFAGTLVIRERLPRSAQDHGAVPPVPPQVMHALGADLAAMDLSAVPDGLWLAMRQLLGRLNELDPQVAQGLAERLAGDLCERTGRSVPVGTPPVMYLGAVLMERQRREWERQSAAAARYAAAQYAAAQQAGQTAQASQAFQAQQAAPGQVPPPYLPPAGAPQPQPPVRVLGYPQPQAPVQPPQVAIPVQPQAPGQQPVPAQQPPAGGGFAPPA
ncbi:RDD family protein [Kitasatospora sp. NPDC049285]|uniref:RDD family protein n=1 Tax=Kitasatospora sp. NPDC049285 TaxID=3157096 RepID=UPI00344423AB